MGSFSLNELLRYGFAGFFGLAIQFVAAGSMDSATEKPMSGALNLTIELMIPFALGAFGYTLHRATQYPIFYWITARLNKRFEDQIELDIERWKHQQNAKSLQPRMGEWAAQVHFLYASALTGLLLLVSGYMLEVETKERFSLALVIVLFVYAVGFWHHYRYQKWEKRVFDYDRALKAD